MRRAIGWTLLGAAIVVALVLVWNRLADARVAAAVAENNSIADTAHAREVREIRKGNDVVVGELRAHLATSQDSAEAYRERWGLERARADSRGRELASAQRSIARLEARLAPDTADVVDPGTDSGVYQAHFEGFQPSRGDTLGYKADLTLPLDTLELGVLTTTLTGALTIDTQFEWEDETPICTVEVRHEAVRALPGRCVEVLGDRPIERPRASGFWNGFLNALSSPLRWVERVVVFLIGRLSAG